MNEDIRFYETLETNREVELLSLTPSFNFDLLEAYSSFLNSGPGRIYVGIEEGVYLNKVVGVDEPEKMRTDILKLLKDRNAISYSSIEEGDISILEVDGKKLLLIEAREAPYYEKPVFLDADIDRVYLRGPYGRRRRDGASIVSLYVENRLISYDERVNTFGYTIKELFKESLEGYARMILKFNPVPKGMDDGKLFERLGLIFPGKEGYVRNGAVLMFGYPHQIKNVYPNHRLSYREATDDRPHLDSSPFTGNLFSFLMDVLPRIEGSIKDLDMDGQLTERLSEEIKDSILDIFTDADFQLPGGLSIERGEHTLRISYPCRTREEGMGVRSSPRNRLIHRLLSRIRTRDGECRGTHSKYEAFLDAGYPEPVFHLDVERDLATLTFLLPSTPEARSLSREINAYRVLGYLSSKEEGVTRDETNDLLHLHPKYVSSILSRMHRAGLLRFVKEGRNKRFYLNG